ncbi:pyridoxal phosphate-dependent aminotransferase [Alphaproteobacteria bacterium]|nr:pyridoxal phosphate-dependent aminotransferase [Alphaproteobacteria bacterium]
MSHQSLQDFFDSAPALAADHNLSASAAEPLTEAELLAFDPSASDKLAAARLTYPERYGPEWMREKVAAKYDGLTPANILLSSGLEEALGMLFLAMVEPGDRIIVMNPCYPPQRSIPVWRGAEVITWDSRVDLGWMPDLDELRDLLKQPTKAVVVTLPQNPTGFMPDAAWLAELVEIVQGAGAYLISDEIYSGLSASETPRFPNLVCRYEKAVTLHGLSKIYGLPGLRVGWMAIRDQALVDGVHQIKNLFNAYFPVPVEIMAEIALQNETALVARTNTILKECIDTASQFFAKHGNLFDWQAPTQGSISFPRWTGPGGAKELSDRLLIEHKLVFAPSTCFQKGDEHLRLCLARKDVKPGLERLAKALETLT